MDVRGNRVNSSSIWEIRKTNHFINISEHLNSKALSKQGAIKRQWLAEFVQIKDITAKIKWDKISSWEYLLENS